MSDHIAAAGDTVSACVSDVSIMRWIRIYINLRGGETNGSKDQINKNGTEEGTFL